MAGGIVSDGFSVVKTTADGSYTIKLASQTEHVFISVPSGYAMPYQKNIAYQYKVIATDSDFNFELQPLVVNADKHQFMIWADPQVKNDTDYNSKIFKRSNDNCY